MDDCSEAVAKQSKTVWCHLVQSCKSFPIFLAAYMKFNTSHLASFKKKTEEGNIKELFLKYNRSIN